MYFLNFIHVFLHFLACLSLLLSSIVDEDSMQRCLKTATIDHFSFNDTCAFNLQAPCGKPAIKPTLLTNTRIIGGETAKPYSWPWQTSLQYWSDGEWKHLCGASIVSNCYVLTAAHCVEEYEIVPEQLRLVAGVHDLRDKTDGSVHRISKVVFYPHYKGALTQWNHDIAILKVNPPFVYSQSISNVCLPKSVPLNRTSAAATGWGTTREGGPLSDILMQVTLPTIPWQECYTIYHNAINENKFCAGYLKEGGRDTCQGDSGGPLVTKSGDSFVLSGITSVGSNCALPNKPGIYVNVINYVMWVYKFLLDVNECRSSQTNQCEQVCVNMPGTYKCECCHGYTLVQDRFCSYDCGRPERTPKIRLENGILVPTDTLHHPWMVQIKAANEVGHWCSGVVISSEWVLTSALCFPPEQAVGLYKVISKPEIVKEVPREMGSYYEKDEGSVDEGVQLFDIERIHFPHEFDSLSEYKQRNFGLALVKLKGRLRYNKYAKPICLSSQAVKDGVLGWYVLRKPNSDMLFYKQVNTVSKEQCSNLQLSPLYTNEFCAGFNSANYVDCEQDLGSPLVTMAHDRVVGLGIASKKCTFPGERPVYLSLENFKGWILDVIKGYYDPKK